MDAVISYESIAEIQASYILYEMSEDNKVGKKSNILSCRKACVIILSNSGYYGLDIQLNKT